MSIKEEADKVQLSRKEWGDTWDDYSDRTHIEIVMGKMSRTWNLLMAFFKARHENASAAVLDELEGRIQEELLDGYNYARHLRERYRE